MPGVRPPALISLRGGDCGFKPAAGGALLRPGRLALDFFPLVIFSNNGQFAVGIGMENARSSPPLGEGFVADCHKKIDIPTKRKPPQRIAALRRFVVTWRSPGPVPTGGA